MRSAYGTSIRRPEVSDGLRPVLLDLRRRYNSLCADSRAYSKPFSTYQKQEGM